MKYYSTVLNKVYDTAEECEKAEKIQAEAEQRHLELKNKRAERAKEVEEAIKHANELLNAFIKDYGSYHTSLTTDRDADLINWLFRIF